MMSGKARSFTVPGEPVGKARPRVTKRGITYTPRKTAEYERLVRLCYVSKGHCALPMKGPIAMSVEAVFSVPRSLTKAERARRENGDALPQKKPDADNILKACADALNGLAYEDDKQICKAVVTKRYCNAGEEPHVRITLENIVL